MRGFAVGFGLICIALISFQLSHVDAQDDATKPEFYTTKVRPILQANCSNCHLGTNRRGGLSLNTRESTLKGGHDGTDLVPGDASKSLLIKLIRHEGPANDPMPMPPKKP